MNKQKLSLFFCFVLMLFSSTYAKADTFNQDPKSISKSSSIGLYSKKTLDVKQKGDSSGLFNSSIRLRAIGGGPITGFEDTGASENEGAYVDSPNAPVGAFPGVFLLCLAVGYGIYRKKSENRRINNV